MNSGEIEEGAMVLRAKIDMANPEYALPRSDYLPCSETPAPPYGYYLEKVYPMYDFAHGQSDFFEGVTSFSVHTSNLWYTVRFTTSLHRLVERRKDPNDNRPCQTEFNKSGT